MPSRCPNELVGRPQVFCREGLKGQRSHNAFTPLHDRVRSASQNAQSAKILSNASTSCGGTPATSRCSSQGPVESLSREGLAELPLRRRLVELLRREDLLEKITGKYFQRIAVPHHRQHDGFGNPALDLLGFARLTALLANEIGVPEHAFGTGQDAYVKFDFNGDGVLQECECLKIVRCYLEEFKRTLIGSSSLGTNIPFKSMQCAGYRFGKELGSGSQGIMKLASNRDGDDRCVKLVRKQAVKKDAVVELRQEFETMRNLNNDRIARTFEIFQDSEFYYLVNEPYFGGDFSKLRKNASTRGVAITETWWRNVFRQCFEGLKYLHEQAMIHCDIKEPNLMLKTSNFHDPEIVIVDFGIVQEAAKDWKRLCGTPGYIPPETLETTKWYPKGDCFSFGVTMMQLVLDQVPEANAGPHGSAKMGIFSLGARSIDEIFQITRLRHPPFHRMPKGFAGLTKLLEKLLEKQQDQRINAAQALKDPWFCTIAIGNGPLPTAMSVASAQPSRTVVDVMPRANQGAVIRRAALELGCVPQAVQRKAFVSSPLEAPPQRPLCINTPSAVASARPACKHVLRQAAHIVSKQPGAILRALSPPLVFALRK